MLVKKKVAMKHNYFLNVFIKVEERYYFTAIVLR